MESALSPVYPRAISTSEQLVFTRDIHTTVTSQECDSVAEDISHVHISIGTPSTTSIHQNTYSALSSSLPRSRKPTLPSSLPSYNRTSSISAPLSFPSPACFPPSPTCSPSPSPTIDCKDLDLFYDGYRPEVVEAFMSGMRSSKGRGDGATTSEPCDYSSEMFWMNSYSSSGKDPSYSCTYNSADALYDAICYGAASTD
eukprot:gene21475-28448_t